MQVTMLYFDDCPNWKVARQRLHEALGAAGLAKEVDVTYQMVDTPEEAERVGFRGRDGRGEQDGGEQRRQQSNHACALSRVGWRAKAP